jgi:hypothetical protein
VGSDTDAYNWEDSRPIGLTGSGRENSPSFLNLSNRLSHVRSVPSQTIEIYGSIGAFGAGSALYSTAIGDTAVALPAIGA